MHYNEQLPLIEIIVLKCLKIDISPKKRRVPEPLEPSLGMHPVVLSLF